MRAYASEVHTHPPIKTIVSFRRNNSDRSEAALWLVDEDLAQLLESSHTESANPAVNSQWLVFEVVSEANVLHHLTVVNSNRTPFRASRWCPEVFLPDPSVAWCKHNRA